MSILTKALLLPTVLQSVALDSSELVIVELVLLELTMVTLILILVSAVVLLEVASMKSERKRFVRFARREFEALLEFTIESVTFERETLLLRIVLLMMNDRVTVEFTITDGSTKEPMTSELLIVPAITVEFTTKEAISKEWFTKLFLSVEFTTDVFTLKESTKVEFDDVILMSVEFVQLTLIKVDWMIVHPLNDEKLTIERLILVPIRVELSTVALLQLVPLRKALKILHEVMLLDWTTGLVRLLKEITVLTALELRQVTDVPFDAAKVQFVAMTFVRFDAFWRPFSNVPLKTVVLAQDTPASLLFCTLHPVSLD